MDATVPLAAAVSGKATRLLGVPQGSAGAAGRRRWCPTGVKVVSALHTVSAPVLGDLDRELDEDVLVAGDSKDAKRRVAEIIGAIPGPAAGRLRPRSRRRASIEGLTPLLISVNIRHKTHAGVKLTGLPDVALVAAPRRAARAAPSSRAGCSTGRPTTSP